MPRSPVDLSGEAVPTRAQCLCRLLQPITTASRNGAADRLHSAARFLPLRMQGTRSWLFRSWVDCTMTTTGQPEAEPRGRVYSWWTRSIYMLAENDCGKVIK